MLISNPCLAYFMDWDADIPLVEAIESDWPLSTKSFTYNHKNIPPEPHSL